MSPAGELRDPFAPDAPAQKAILVFAILSGALLALAVVRTDLRRNLWQSRLGLAAVSTSRGS